MELYNHKIFLLGMDGIRNLQRLSNSYFYMVQSIQQNIHGLAHNLCKMLSQELPTER